MWSAPGSEQTTPLATDEWSRCDRIVAKPVGRGFAPCASKSLPLELSWLLRLSKRR